MTRSVIWGVLGPAIFLVVLIGFSAFAGVSGVPADRIGQVVSGQGAAILCVASLLFGLAALVGLPVREIWQGRPRAQDLVVGVVTGTALALAYLWVLAPALTLAQRVFGDYVPPGSVSATVSGNLALFFVANVMLAPVVEETVYRGFLLPRLVGRFGQVGGLIGSCIAFGLLHWLGGVWYMLLTGLVAGGAFAILRLRRGGIIAPFAAHLTLNSIEFLAALTR